MEDLDFDQLIKTEFLQEAGEILQDFESALLGLEASAQPDLVLNAMFRHAHSIKGSGLAAGFEQMGSLAHKVEGLLDALRADTSRLSPESVDALLKGVDGLKECLDSYKQDLSAQPAVEGIENLLADAQRKCSGESVPSAKAPSAEGSSRPADAGSKISDEQPPPPSLNSEESLLDNISLANHAAEADQQDYHYYDEICPQILLVEDEEVLRDELAATLSDLGKVHAFADAESALEAIDATTVHLIVSDLRLPGMSGEKMIKVMVQRGIHLPVIFISGFAERENIISFVKLGAFDFFDKPFNFEDLKASAIKGIRDHIFTSAITEIGALAFRSYMRFRRIDELIDTLKMNVGKRDSLRALEEDMLKIGNVCLKAQKFSPKPR